MTFEQVALGRSESGELVKFLASPGFDVLMRILRGERDHCAFKIGNAVAGMPMGKFASAEEISAATHADAVRARDLTAAITELERLATTDRDAFVETRVIP